MTKKEKKNQTETDDYTCWFTCSFLAWHTGSMESLFLSFFSNILIWNGCAFLFIPNSTDFHHRKNSSFAYARLTHVTHVNLPFCDIVDFSTLANPFNINLIGFIRYCWLFVVVGAAAALKRAQINNNNKSIIFWIISGMFWWLSMASGINRNELCRRWRTRTFFGQPEFQIDINVQCIKLVKTE